MKSQADWTARPRGTGVGELALKSSAFLEGPFPISPPPFFILIPDSSDSTAYSEFTCGGEIGKFPVTNSLHFIFLDFFFFFLAMAESHGSVRI